jgi:hypothetical protein
MTVASTKQRMISVEDLQSPEYQAVPDAAKPTALGLWTLLDVMGRGPMDELWIARELYQDRAPSTAAEMVTEHLLMMLEAGFLTTYKAAGEEWILLLRPLKADKRRARIDTPEPPPETWMSVAVERENARAGARARVRLENEASAAGWANAREDRERPARPERPHVLDAPPIGCPKHPDGLVSAPCGPCGTAREQRTRWMAARIYEERLATYYESMPAPEVDDDEPF